MLCVFWYEERYVMRDSPGLVKEKKKIPDKIAAIMRLWNGNDEILTASEPIGIFHF